MKILSVTSGSVADELGIKFGTVSGSLSGNPAALEDQPVEMGGGADGADENSEEAINA